MLGQVRPQGRPALQLPSRTSKPAAGGMWRTPDLEASKSLLPACLPTACLLVLLYAF